MRHCRSINVLLVEVPPQFIALCHASGVSPQATLRGMAAMLCGLRYDEDNRLLPLDAPASRCPAQWARSRVHLLHVALWYVAPIARDWGMGMREETWREVKTQLPVGSMIEGRVTRHEAYGMFVDIGLECEGLIQIVDIKDEGRATPDDYPSIGTLVVARVLGFKENNRQVCLGIKPSHLHAG